MDWNEDGLTDLIVGEHDGHIKYFMAVTADSLTEMDDLQAAGEYINGGLVSAPVIFDWNNDSLNDLIVGFASPETGSTIKLYLNTGTTGNPILAAGVDVLCAGEPVGAYGCTPCFYDLDQDGLTDIVYGETAGRLYFCKNTGTASSPVFATPEPLQSESGVISLELNSSPFLADWNDDGYPDMLAGCGEKGHLFAFLSPYTTGIASGDNAGYGLSSTICENPVSSSITIEVNMNQTGVINASLYNISGRMIQNLGTEELNSGINSIHFAVDELPSGVYLLMLFNEAEAVSRLITIIGGLH
ncbi:MAG: T9SS type A sorting domain-containing protein [Candidatus Sabulitectum sp.]|nr:T9SS type A sorting domain-containing protein [Candidatus Sabulitectum sp.]